MKKRIMIQNTKCHKALKKQKYHHEPKGSIRRSNKDGRSGENPAEEKRRKFAKS
jgi:hypothetical protein